MEHKISKSLNDSGLRQSLLFLNKTHCIFFTILDAELKTAILTI